MLTNTGNLVIGNFTHFSIGFLANIAGGWQLILRNEDAMEKLMPENCEAEFYTVGDQTFACVKS